MKNAIYEGIILHKRSAPKEHQFKYRVNYFYFDLSKPHEVPTIPFLLDFNAKSYLCEDDVRKEIDQHFGAVSKDISRVFILTQLSYMGFCFNPVSFYYCFNTDNQLIFVLSHITNTPWGEKHIECFDYKKTKGDFSFPKTFHVSPFMPMEIDYHWSFNIPDERVQVLMTNRKQGEEESFFIACLDLGFKKLNFKNLLMSMLLFPLMSFKTIAGIYWQALLLYLKKVPFHTHPKKREAL